MFKVVSMLVARILLLNANISLTGFMSKRRRGLQGDMAQ